MGHFIFKPHKAACIGMAAVCITFSVTGCASNIIQEETPAVSHQNDAKPFSLPESLTSTSSSIGGINSIYISKQNGDAYALITEESDASVYNKGKYLTYLTETVGIPESELDTAKAIETDSAIIYRQDFGSKIYCYINAKNLHRNIVITLKRPGDSVNDARELIHSYLNSIGEDDKNYIHSDYLAEPLNEEDVNTGASKTEPETEVGATTQSSGDGGDASTTESKTEEKAKKVTADDLITVIDKSAAHENGQ